MKADMTPTHPTQASVPPWEQGQCAVPMWSFGAPAGSCGKKAYGHQLPAKLLDLLRPSSARPYCFGHCCPMHGGPAEGEPIVFQDGLTPEGRPMWCAVMPGFINLQESPAGFSGDPVKAVEALRAAIGQERPSVTADLLEALQRLSDQAERLRLPGQAETDAEKNAKAAIARATSLPSPPTTEGEAK